MQYCFCCTNVSCCLLKVCIIKESHDTSRAQHIWILEHQNIAVGCAIDQELRDGDKSSSAEACKLFDCSCQGLSEVCFTLRQSTLSIEPPLVWGTSTPFG